MQFLNIGPGEMILILVIALVVFGPGKLPEIGRSVGRGINEFRRATSDLTREFSQSMDDVKQPFDELKGAVSGTAVKTTTVATATCPNCSAVNPASNKFCKECGGRMVQEEATVACSACAAVNPVSNRFCKECGAAIALPQSEPVVSEDANTWKPDASAFAAPVALDTVSTQGEAAETVAETATVAASESEAPIIAEPADETSAPAEPVAEAPETAAAQEPVAAEAEEVPATAEAPIEQPGTWHPTKTEAIEPEATAAEAEHNGHKHAPVAG